MGRVPAGESPVKGVILPVQGSGAGGSGLATTSMGRCFIHELLPVIGDLVLKAGTEPLLEAQFQAVVPGIGITNTSTE